MKVIKYISFFVYIFTVSFIYFLYTLVSESKNYIESNYRITVSLTGMVDTKVMADRVLAVDGIKDVRVIASSDVYEEFKKSELFSKFKLEENPFSDRLEVILETLKTDPETITQNIRKIPGVSDVVFDRATISIYKKLNSVFTLIRVVLISLIGYSVCVCLFFVACRKKEGLLSIKDLYPSIYIFLLMSVICFLIITYLYNFYNIGHNYIFNVAFLIVSSIFATLIYEK